MNHRAVRDTATALGVSTYVREQHEELDGALRALFDVPAAVPMEWTLVGPSALERLVVEVGGFSIELMRDDPGAVRGVTWNLRARAVAGGADASILAALVRRFRARERHDGPALLALAERSFRFREIGEHAYRDITPAAAGGRAIVRLGFGCNQDCGFCWQGRDWPDPPPERYAQWVRELAAAGARELVFSGGEPTLHRGLPDLIRLARELGMDTASRRYADVCGGCAMRDGCLGVRREYLDAFGGAGLRPFGRRPPVEAEARPSVRRAGDG